jgi:hypothetical protein
MKRLAGPIFFLLLIAGAGFLAWRLLFPNPEVVIRKRLGALATVASIASNEAPAARMLNAQKLSTFFASDARIHVEVPGHSEQVFNGVDEIRGAAMAARTGLNSLKVEFPDIVVSLGPDKTTALVELTAKGTVPGDKEIYVQELKGTLKKIDGDWLITNVETVKTLR